MIDILEKITTLREERHWTEYQLAEKSGLTQSTISSWYRKNLVPSIFSLTKVCDAFGMTLSQFFIDDSENHTVLLNERQLQLLAATDRLSEEQYQTLIAFSFYCLHIKFSLTLPTSCQSPGHSIFPHLPQCGWCLAIPYNGSGIRLPAAWQSLLPFFHGWHLHQNL